MKKFGTFKGVFVPSTEAILGTVLFLLLPALIGYTGLIPMLAIIVIAHSVTIATTFSLSDCATNLNNIGGGGMYALARRSLGKALGGSIGIQLYIAQAASIGFYCIGFVEPLHEFVSPLLAGFIPFFAESAPAALLLQRQILASAVFVLFFIIVMIGADFTLKIQTLILFILGASVAAIFISPMLGLEYAGEPLYNWKLNYSGFFDFLNFKGISTGSMGASPLTVSVFFLAFTQFFPAVTGIDAGVGMSGDLKNPKKSLVTGTFAAIAVTFIIYILSAVVFSLMDGSNLVHGVDEMGSPIGAILTELLGIKRPFPMIIPGLMILLGILFATSSSALSCFMTAPRTAQSLCQNDTLPKFLGFLANDFKKGGSEPRFAAILTFFIGMSVIWMGSISTAATIVGISFLVVYGWVNGSAFLERISGNPSFRPTSKGHWLISLYGFLASIAAILLFNPLVGGGIIIVQFIIFRLILKHKSEGKLEGVWWGVLFSLMTKTLRAFRKIVQGSKNWRPIISAAAFSGKENCPYNIGYLCRILAAYKGLAYINVLGSGGKNETFVDKDKFDVPASYINVRDPQQAIMNLLQMAAPGGIISNTLLLEYSSKIDSVEIIQKALELQKNILIVKNGEKLLKHEHIDVWWRGEENGNLMVLLAYIINSAPSSKEGGMVRVIRKLGKDENIADASAEINGLLDRARLDAKVLILPGSSDDFQSVLFEVSKRADLIMLGMPGKKSFSEAERLFNLDEYFFRSEIKKFDKLPPVLFVKSAGVMKLIEN